MFKGTNAQNSFDLVNIPEKTETLELREGIWYSKNNSDVSYPENDNDLCFQIEDKSFWFKHRNNCILEMIKNFPPAGEIFDIGGGNGYVSKWLQEHKFITVVVEPGEKGALNAQSRNITNIICSSLEEAGFKERSIPAIGCFDVLEHIKDDKDFGNKIKSSLTNGGRLYLSVPSFNALWSDEDIKAGHFRRYSRKKIENLLEEVGFTIEYSTYFFSILLLPVFLFRTIPYRFGYKMGESTLKKAKSEHFMKFPENIIKSMLERELKKIKQRKTIFFGTSCLICAVKKEKK